MVFGRVVVCFEGNLLTLETPAYPRQNDFGSVPCLKLERFLAPTYSWGISSGISCDFLHLDDPGQETKDVLFDLMRETRLTV